jgi:uncharacterized membrane protein HdeD (DUF308 family)
MTELTAPPPIAVHRTRWRWFLALGVALLVLGAAGLGATLLELTSVLVFGPLLLAASIMQLLTGFIGARGRERLHHYLAAGLEAAFGFGIMVHPLHQVVDVVKLIAIFLVVAGLIRLARSLATQPRRRVWFIMTGVVALLLGVSVWIGWPKAGPWFVGVCLAVDFLCHGFSWSLLALAEGKPPPESPA